MLLYTYIENNIIIFQEFSINVEQVTPITQKFSQTQWSVGYRDVR